MTLVVTPGEIVRRAVAGGKPGLLAAAPWWDRIPLGDVASIVNGAPFSSRLFNTQGKGMPLVRIRDVVRGSTETYFDGPYEEVHTLGNGDLLVGMDGDFRAAIWNGGRALLNQRVCKLNVTAPQVYDKRFLFFVLQGYLDAIWAETSAVTVKHLSSRTLAQIPLPLPPLDEQRRIVAILEDHLGRLDISVESLQRALNYLETFRLALFESAIRGAVGDLRFDGDSWPVATLDELQAPGQGSITDGPFGSNLKSSHYTSSGARVIRLQNIGLGHFLDAEAYISLEHFERLRKHAAIPGDLIVASLGDVLPRVCLLPDLGEPTIVKADCIRVRLGDRVRGRWVLMAMLTQKARQWAREELHGVGRQRLGLKAIRSFEVPVPSVSVQDEILAQVDAVLSRSASVELAILAALRRSEGVRKSLLSAAFSGQLSRESLVV